jgi:stage IV sporulation protein FB
VLLGEPPRTEADLNFSLLGIPVRVHPWFWLLTLMLGYNMGDVASVLTWIVAVFLAIVIHELGHALVMRAYGFRPWIILYGLGGQTSYDPAYAYMSRGSGTLGQILISLAGPVAGFLLVAVLVFGLTLAGYGRGIQMVPVLHLNILPLVVRFPNERLAYFLNDVFFICVVWGLVNLLPIYPLDGGQIAREVLLKLSPRQGIRWSLLLSIVAAGLMVLVGLLVWRSWFTAMLFGYLAYTSIMSLRAYRDRFLG